tara:strand:- start:444 stop:566 length:123 start_codon:yes stop_codon:yes gene_type:complete
MIQKITMNPFILSLFAAFTLLPAAEKNVPSNESTVQRIDA